MRTMRSVPPKPPFRAKETEEKDTADATSTKAAPDGGAFVSPSIRIAREEEVRHVAGRDFEISRPLFYSRVRPCVSLSLVVSLVRAKHEKKRERFSSLLCVSHSPYSLSLSCDTGEV